MHRNIFILNIFILNFLLFGCTFKKPQTYQNKSAQYLKSNYTKSLEKKNNYQSLNKQLLILEYRLDQITQSLANLKKLHEKDIKALKSQIKALKEDQDAISKSLDSISSQIDLIEKKLSNLEQRLKLLENAYFRLVKVSNNLSKEDEKLKFLLRRNFQILQGELAKIKLNIKRINKALRKIPVIKIEKISPSN